MNIHLADTIQRESLYGIKEEYCLESYWAIIKKKGNFMEKQISLFLDSGAFSAWSKGIEIDIQEYIEFIKEHKKYIDVYSVLDSIGDAELTLKNQKIMEKAGLKPLPCFHYGEDLKYLKHYIKNYGYISLGGMVPVSTPQLVMWLDEIYGKYICDKDGNPKVKVHGFGLTSIPLMIRYPWHSVDSTSWVLTGRFGAVYVPKIKNGKYDYMEIPYKINVSDKSPSKKEEGKHVTTFSKMEQKIIFKYFKEKGYVLGKSDKEGETVEPGLCNEYKLRDELNIIYFLDLEKELSKKPLIFKIKKSSGFGLV